jgi:hypothetical protein
LGNAWNWNIIIIITEEFSIIIIITEEFSIIIIITEEFSIIITTRRVPYTWWIFRAVSNEIYGALILEPTIPSTVPVCEKYEDLDDFWLDLAKGQTLKQTNFHQSVGPSVSLQQKHAPTK